MRGWGLWAAAAGGQRAPSPPMDIWEESASYPTQHRAATQLPSPASQGWGSRACEAHPGLRGDADPCHIHVAV